MRRNSLVEMVRGGKNSTRRFDGVVHDAIASALARAAICPSAKIVVGLSGGPDSVALLHAMLELRERLHVIVAAAHLNHGLRGAESDRDENFVRELCARLEVELVVERADGLASNSANLEERARAVRHDFLNRAADALDAEYIALAHHAGDQAETVLMRLLRGAGSAGLGAMAERGPGRLLRPMLSLSRADILGYLRESNLPFVEDLTNSSPIHLRNRIRTELIPMLEREYAPGLGRRLAELAIEMQSLDDLVSSLASREIESMRAVGVDSMRADSDALDITRFAELHPALQAAVLRRFIFERVGDLRRVGRVHIEALMRLALDGGPSDSLNLPRGWRAQREYNLLRMTHAAPLTSLDYSVCLCLDGRTIIEAAGFAFAASTISAADASIPASPSTAMFDAAELGESGLVVRNFKPGDRIRPLGMRGVKKVKNVFIDRKIPQRHRSQFPVVTLDGETVWLPGLVRGRRAPITQSTETVLRVEAYKTAH